MDWSQWLHIILCVVTLNKCQAKNMKTFHSHDSMSDDDDAGFRHMLIDHKTDKLYVGAVNSVYVLLASSLTDVHVRKTGPRMDNVNCPPDPRKPCPEPYKRTAQVSVQQALILDESNNVLVACSTLYYGFCERISLSNYSHVEPVYTSVVPNSGDASVVAFLAGQTLYVAATHTTVGLERYRHVPMIAIRDPRTLKLREETVTSSSRLDLLYEKRATDRVTFKYGFSHHGFTYFVSVHTATQNGQEVSRSYLSRVCDEDLKFGSYVQVTLECSFNGAGSAVVKSAFFGHPGRRIAEHLKGFHTEPALFVSFDDGSTAAMCVYSMEEIKSIFWKTIQKCFQGAGMRGPDYLASQRKCVKADLEIDENYCGDYASVNSPMFGGSDGLSKEAIVVLPGYSLSALLVKSVGDLTVAFLATTRGQLLKVFLRADDLPQRSYYDAFDVEDGARIKSDMLFDKQKMHIYLMTSKQIYRILLANCDVYTSCQSCREARDPHCGWCTLQNRCSLSTNCPNSAVDYHWISFKEECPAISAVPHIVQNSQFLTTQFNVLLSHVPVSDSATSVQCELTNQQLSLSSTSLQPLDASNTITCDVFNQKPKILESKGFVNMDLALKLNGVILASTEIYVYDCSLWKSCHKCASTLFDGCVWCMKDNVCVGNQSECTTSHRLVRDSIQGTDLCPQIRPTNYYDKKILIASGNTTRVIVTGLNIQKLFMTDFKCHFSLAEDIIVGATVKPAIVGHSITCDPAQFSYPGDQGNLSTLVDVYWGEHNILDNPREMQIEVYKCAGLVSSCGQCLTLDTRYHCGWCTDHCSLRSECTDEWLNRNATCPNPSISQFEPVQGPVKGGTLIRVDGVNLGKSPSELAVTIADVPCSVQALNYKPSSSFICVTSDATMVKNGSIVITVNKKYTAKSDMLFNYVEPFVDGVSPLKGPVSGGTAVTIVGQKLDIGNNATVNMRDVYCAVLRRTANELVFKTSSEPMPVESEMTLILDNQQLLLDDKFIYVNDPMITSVKPADTTVSGGITIRALGTNLDSVVNPVLYIQLEGRNFTTRCNATSATSLTCLTPGLKELAEPPRFLQFGFLMDGVMPLRQLSRTRQDINPLKVHEDPVLFYFEETDRVRTYTEDLVLQIEGQEMHAFKLFREDTRILVGNELCELLEFTAEVIKCIPPKEAPHLDEMRNALVLVQLGHLLVEVGSLHYADPNAFQLPIILIAVAAVVILLVIIACICVICVRRRRRKHQQARKPIKNATQTPRNGNATEMIPMLATDQAPNRPLPPEPPSEHVDVLKNVRDDNLRNNIQEVLIPNSRLTLNHALGKGHFGCVYAATLDANTAAATKVAVKTLQGNKFDEKAVESFLKEGVTMKNFDHPHILALLGMCMDEQGNPMVILPYMANGDLRSYVKDKKKSFTARQLLRLCQQVAEGMTYLASLNFVHRDLAARNCMIDQEMVVKVSDFGLSRSLYEKKYYVSMEQQRSKMPIKWMALESLDDMIFTTKSDVWSFGVLMWELMTRCVTPYPDVDVFDMRNYLVSGQRLKQPKYCPVNIYQIMCSCWDIYPERRPTFTDLVNKLEMLLNPPSAQLPQPTEEPMYVNVPTESSDYLAPISLGNPHV